MKTCIECGACCCNPYDNKWIEVSEKDALLIDPSLLQSGDIEKYAMRQEASGKCVALAGNIGEACGCLIYENRPSICRKVQQGDSICLTLKELHKVT